MKDFKTFFQFLEHNKLFTFVNVVGLGISLMLVLLLADMVGRQLTVERGQKDTDRTYILCNEKSTFGHYGLGQRLQDRYPEIEDWCAYSGLENLKVEQGEETAKIKVAAVRSNFFSFFNYPLAEGNRDQLLNDAHSIVLTRSCAYRLFGNEPPLGKSVQPADGGTPFMVTGIVEDFRNTLMPEELEALIPYESAERVNALLSMHDEHMGYASGTLLFLRGAHNTRMENRSDDIAGYLKQNFWFYQRGEASEVHFIPLRDFYFYDQAKAQVDVSKYNFRLVMFYLGIGLLILLMAVCNYISMSVAQTSYRAKEMATRRLLGSSRPDIFWRMIAESFVLTLIALCIGFLLAKAAEPKAMELLRVKLDLTGDLNLFTLSAYLLFTVTLAILAGFTPATILSNYNPLDVVKGTFRRKTKAVYLRALNIVQSGITIGLLACTLFLGVVIHRVLNAPLGYQYGQILHMDAQGKQAQLLSFRDEALKLPFVKRVSFAQGTPLKGGNRFTQNVRVKGRIHEMDFYAMTVDSAFLQMFGIRIFDDRKLPHTSQNWFVSESAMKELGEEADFVEDCDESQMSFTVAGQFRDFHIRSVMAAQYPIRINLLRTEEIQPFDILVEVRDDANPADCQKQLTALMQRINGGQPVGSRWYAEQITGQYKEFFRLSKLVNLFTGAALLISLLGLTAMNVYFIAQRKQDIAIRKIFGSTQAGEIRQLMRFSLISIAAGLLIAVPIMTGGVRFITTYLKYDTPFAWWIPPAAILIVVVLTLALVWLIGRNTVSENPVKHLKTE